MNVRLISLVIPGMRYSSHPALPSTGDISERLEVNADRQIPRRASGVWRSAKDCVTATVSAWTCSHLAPQGTIRW